MLTFFTDPYPNELLYSAISRYHECIGNDCLKDTLVELFGKDSIIPNFYLASNLLYLCKQLNQYTPEELINSHTVFPYYKPFIPHHRQEKIKKQMLAGNCEGIYLSLGMTIGKNYNTRAIKYCRKCVIDDLASYDEAYIHREHQLQGILVCPHHEEYLQTYNYDYLRASRIKYISLDTRKLSISNSIINFNEKDHVKLMELSKLGYRLLALENDLSSENMFERYYLFLKKKCFCTFNGEVNQKFLFKEFINFYGVNLLEKLQCSIDINYEYNWLKVITRKNERTLPPIKHLLMINFLVGDIDKFFFSEVEQDEPFGAGPWPCLNKICKHYKEDVISSINITKDSKTSSPVATLKCSCGYTYSRRGPDKSIEDKYRVGKTKEYGQVWNDKLIELLKADNYSSRQLGKIMGCDANTIRKKDKEIGFDHFSNNDYKVIISNIEISKEISPKINEYKTIILNVVNANKTMPKAKLKVLVAKEFRYLSNKDKSWLDKAFQGDEVDCKNKIYVHSSGKVNWESRDSEYIRLVQQKHEEILKRRPFERVTKSKIGKELNISNALYIYSYRLPNTIDLLKSIIESPKQYKIRKINELMKYNEEEMLMLPLWKIRKMAGVSMEEFKIFYKDKLVV